MTNKDEFPTQQSSQLSVVDIFSTIANNFDFLYNFLGKEIGLIQGKYDISNGRVQVGIIYIQKITDNNLISNQIIEPLLNSEINIDMDSNDILIQIQSKFIYTLNSVQSNQMKIVVDSLLVGKTVLFIDEVGTALIIESRKINKRAIEKPENEVGIFGSKDSFIEDLDTNISMIIDRLPSPNLCFETFTIGTLSRSQVKLVWINNISNTKIIEEVRLRLRSIDIDSIECIGLLGQLIEDKPLSIFPKWKQTQRPDVVTKYLTDGYFSILCSSSPFALIAPGLFWDNFKTMDDYSEGTFASSYLRIVRYVGFIIAVCISPLYLSFVAYNHSIVPPPLALNIAIGRDGVPFPSVIELIIMTFSIDLIREASLRMSGSVGFFIGVLSALIIGESSVTAGYVSASVIIVVAIAAISSFAISSTTLVYPTKLINYFFIFLAGIFGMFGLVSGTVIVIWHLVSLNSFGVPYLYPLIPFDLEGMKDMFIRAQKSTLKKRLRILAPYNRTRINNNKDKGE